MKDLQELITMFSGKKRDDLWKLTSKNPWYIGLILNGHKNYSPKFQAKLDEQPLYSKEETENWVKEIKIYKK